MWTLEIQSQLLPKQFCPGELTVSAADTASLDLDQDIVFSELRKGNGDDRELLRLGVSIDKCQLGFDVNSLAFWSLLKESLSGCFFATGSLEREK
jgi:hypothetical protein